MTKRKSRPGHRTDNARILDKDGKVVFEGENQEAEKIWAGKLERSGVLISPRRRKGKGWR